MLKKKSIIFALVLAVLAVGAAFAYVKYVYPRIVEPAETYAKARNLYNGGNYMKAALELESIRDYSDSSKLAKQAWKLAGDNAYNEGKFDLASSCYEKAGADETDVARMDECYLRLAENAFANNRLSGGEMYLQCVSNAPGNADRIDALRMNTANSIMDSGLSIENIESAVDRLKLCSETASPQIMDMLVNRGRDALLIPPADSARRTE